MESFSVGYETQRTPSAGNLSRLIYGLTILAIAGLVGATYFTGLENHPLYSALRFNPSSPRVSRAMTTWPATGR